MSAFHIAFKKLDLKAGKSELEQIAAIAVKIKKLGSFMWNIIGAIIALGVLVTVHEFGHFIAARLFGVKVEKFSIGFGKKLFSFRKWDTEFRISLIPLGGYVKMVGENPDEEILDAEHSYRTKTWWQRALIAFAGPFLNLIFAVLLFITSFAIGRNYEDLQPVVGVVEENYSSIFQPEDEILEVNGNEIKGWNQIVQYTNTEKENIIEIQRGEFTEIIDLPALNPNFWYEGVKPFVPAQVGQVTPGMSAFKSGLMDGDEILEVDRKPVSDWYEMREMITDNPNDEVVLKIRRNDQEFEKTLKLETNIYQDNKVIGITMPSPVKIKERYNLIESIGYGTVSTISFVYMNYALLFKLVAHPEAIKSNIGGPVMIYTMSQQTAGKGFDVVLLFLASISIVLMIMNLLPIPVLDGGHIFFCFIEGIFKKPLSLKVQIILQNIGIFILLFLMVFAFWNDFSRIFSRNSAIQQQETEMSN
ncbi:MAG: RIP metalloprotease RseP [Candidatus Cloacimonetes bacterium]|nr:RIP metalloprotease RseP [Candidatus Cloacimonadota bacterium]